MPREDMATQNRRPWQAVLRTSIACLIGLLPILPAIAQTLHIETVPVIASTLAVTAAVTRVLALSQVESWLRQFVPWLAADIYPPRDKETQ